MGGFTAFEQNEMIVCALIKTRVLDKRVNHFCP